MWVCDRCVRFSSLLEPDLAIAIGDFSDDIKTLAAIIQLIFDKLLKLRVDDEDHSDAEVERPLHLFTRNVPDLLHQIENRRLRPASLLEYYVNIPRQDTRNIIHQTSARDMRQSLDDAFVFD